MMKCTMNSGKKSSLIKHRFPNKKRQNCSFCLFCVCSHHLCYFSSHPQVSLKLERTHEGGIFMPPHPQSLFLEELLRSQSQSRSLFLSRSQSLSRLRSQSLPRLQSQSRSLLRLRSQSRSQSQECSLIQPQLPLLKNNRNNKIKQQFIFRLISSIYLLLFYSFSVKKFLALSRPVCRILFRI